MYPLMYFIDIPFFKSIDKEECEEITDLEEELRIIKQKMLLYSIIVDRYKDIIESKEEKSVSTLKYLINPEDKFIHSKVDEIKKEFQEYSIEKAVIKSIEYIKTIKTIKWPVSFWLSFEDMDKFKLGDEMDKCLFLCSLFKALDIESKILVDEDKKPFVFLNIDSLFFLIDCEEGIKIQGSKEEILNSKTFIYSFSDKEYEDLTEEEIKL